jgi:AAA15 family ATPase/GTPase
LGNALKWFQSGLKIIDINQDNDFFSLYSAAKAKDDEHLRAKISHLLEAADFGIFGLDIQEKTYTEQNLPQNMPQELRPQLSGKKRLDVYMHHPHQDGDEVRFAVQEESYGTQRLFALSSPLLEVLENGWILFVDELDASLHPLLLRHLIKLFHNAQTNPNGAQLIFNTHDTTLLDGSLFRRDQIWFMEKDREGSSHLYSLLDFSPRQGEALAKGYLIGRYGAIPFFNDARWMELNHEEA